jgi:FAD/FMN-containing dehydrogenase
VGRTFSRRKLLKAGALGAAFLAFPDFARAAPKPARSGGFRLNDASRLNPVSVARHQIIKTNGDDAWIAELRALLKEAAEENRPFAVAGARHSMGGQCIPRDGIAVTFQSARIEPDTKDRTYRAQSGVRWRDAIRALDPLGFSVAVMQSNHDFSVGGTLSVNAHGWPAPFGPFCSTVRSFRMMLSDGTLMECSRSKNEELFALACGGYWLFGILLDAEIEMVENVLLLPEHEFLRAEDFGERFEKAVRGSGTRMAYGRLSVARGDFLRDAILVNYRQLTVQPAKLQPAKASTSFQFLSRNVYRAQIGSDAGKRARWFAEKQLAQRMKGSRFTRNSLLSYPVSALAGNDQNRTDILHEYFVPPSRLEEFLQACRELIPRSGQDLLNVTLRYVETDSTSVLSFAPGPRIGAVMSFSQRMRDADERSMEELTDKLIDRALTLGGSYYLPYRLHARRDQMRTAYPRMEEFAARKRHYDPKLMFRNLLWDRYFAES